MAIEPPVKPVVATRGSRAAAFLLDLMLLLVIGSFASGQPFAGRIAFALMALLYFWLLPLTPLQGTPGKWICRIRLSDRSGGRLNLRNAGMRALAFTAWCSLGVFLLGNPAFASLGSGFQMAVCFVFPLPWLTLGFRPGRESLFDLLAGTVVTRIAAGKVETGAASTPRRTGTFAKVMTVVVLVLFGAALSVTLSAMRDRELRIRIAYAMAATDSLKKAVAAFHVRERRWPTPAELGVAEWTPYPDGGGYRLQKDGSIAINFTVLPELKELVITYRPVVSANGGGIEWQCSSAPAKPARYVPATCRAH